MSSTDPARSASDPTRAVVVLAGGRAERFGSDKTRASVDGVSLLERVLGVAGRLVPPIDEVLVVGPWAPPGVRHVTEPERFGGPLVALGFALGEVSAPLVLVLAADHPELAPALLELLIRRLAEDVDADAVVPVRDGRREPLVAAYRRSVGVAITEVLDARTRSLQSLLGVVKTVEVAEDEWREVDPEGRSFRDVDHPEDLDRHRP